ncbi:hypothetical protein [[Mycoplasma] gypis]|uniref:Uncharacterized protein n=1 Tax=[Mycoplasma] gypis TaxID=92404 RepID=A0ABZ2RNI4_9BACT|nr:hypothetical protein [[Mycoplasma] gypis]MBN0919420.1 hypothetical protein [[Mycoplasma] gypis]
MSFSLNWNEILDGNAVLKQWKQKTNQKINSSNNTNSKEELKKKLTNKQTLVSEVKKIYNSIQKP